MATLTVSAADEKRVKALGFLNNKGTDYRRPAAVHCRGGGEVRQWQYHLYYPPDH